ncbi:hypothetical protein F4778DRAFT_250522 [Xylariomycetidae sp. FL2044]|nr:hypothetical protein F4778DRAFT_250522 [Xylariomycetidae sp. FL2044]
MCEPCLKKSFRLSIKDPQQMPPKCCTSDCIPLRYVDRLFDNKFKRTWNRKFAEFSTQNRIYCPARKCGEWIKPSQIHRHRSGRKVGKCGRCDTRVCCECNNKWHDSRKCPTDEATKQILQQAKEEGWQRCFNCRAMVELKEGCNHMTCRCGSEFCMICGLKWKGCECPWFNYDAVEQDRLDHMEPPMPVMERDRLGGDVVSSPRGPRIGTNPGPALHSRQMTYEEEMLRRRLQVQRDEDYARRLHYEDDDEEDDYGGLGDIIGIGNTAGHFLNDDYRRISPNVNVPAPPPPPPPPFERTSSVGDYVAGVNRARGVRGSSMERRLAERFSEQRQGTSPAHRAFGHPIPMPPLPPHAVGPPPPPPVPLAPVPIVRRHTMDEDVHIGPSGGRMMDRIPPRRAVTRGFMEEVEPHTPLRRRTREQLPPSDSALAGLTGPGSGMNRVAEWAVHVKVGEPPPPSHAIVTR